MKNFDIKVFEPRRIEAHYGYIPFMYSMGNGTILIKCFTGTDKLMSDDEFERTYKEDKRLSSSEEYMHDMLKMKEDVNQSSDLMYWFFRSDDSGKTWGNTGAPDFTSLIELKDGTLLGLFRIGREDSPCHKIKTWRSKDKGMTWEGPDYSSIIGPKMAKDSSLVFHRSIVELENGAILATAYARFDGDEKHRAVIYRSMDKGESFHYYSTIAYDPDIDNVDGITEPVMRRLNNGDLLCLMRTNAYLPLLQCRSSNDGATWSRPEKIGADGVDPDMICLDNDTLVCSYGRPGVWLMFGEDGCGKRWTDRTCLWQADNGRNNIQYFKINNEEKYHYYVDSVLECERSLCLERSCCYTALCKIGPDRFLAAYCAPESQSDCNVLPLWMPEDIKQYFIWITEIQLVPIKSDRVIA